MTVCFVTYKRFQNDVTRYPHLFTGIAIHGDVFEGWSRPGDGSPSRHYFVSLSRIESIEFWDIVGSSV